MAGNVNHGTGLHHQWSAIPSPETGSGGFSARDRDRAGPSRQEKQRWKQTGHQGNVNFLHRSLSCENNQLLRVENAFGRYYLILGISSMVCRKLSAIRKGAIVWELEGPRSDFEQVGQGRQDDALRRTWITFNAPPEGPRMGCPGQGQPAFNSMTVHTRRMKAL